ncbi:MAG: hypothetical protein NC177_10990 [Ruminococcus flavefaciens]|nr:hypothetical protein [Ruminococcus flavefaciens]
MKKLIEKYCTERHTINGVKTYIVPSEHYKNIYHDIEVSDIPVKEHCLSFIRYIENSDIPELLLSIVSLYRDNVQYFVYCYRYDGKLYHVALTNGWLCLECRQPNAFDGVYAMPMHEDDPTFLPHDVTPEIPPVFKKIPCQKCGKLLNRRFLKIKEENI